MVKPDAREVLDEWLAARGDAAGPRELGVNGKGRARRSDFERLVNVPRLIPTTVLPPFSNQRSCRTAGRGGTRTAAATRNVW
jgi:hypothetical protein